MVQSKTVSPPGTDVFYRHRDEYQKYLHLIESVQRDFRGDVEELRAQEDWQDDMTEGVMNWVSDTDAIWRLLRRHRYDETKTHTALLAGLAKRMSLGLHRPIPSIPPYSDSSLCYILPLPRYTDRVGRPIVVLTLKEVRRDEHGKMDDLKEWSWWALEMIRRALHDYWAGDTWDDDKGKSPRGGGGKRGKGGEGCVIMVDANGAGYRNLEVEMLPTLLAVGHNHFPGIFDAVYVVNAGWTHRSMWGIVKRVLPKSALDKIIFLDKRSDIERVFDMEILPEDLGGNDPMDFKSIGNPILHHYSQPKSTPISRQPSRAASPSPLDESHHARTASSSSIADIYHTAENTPSSSRRQSITAGMGLHMTKPPPVLESLDTSSLSQQSSRNSSSSPTKQGALQRIKSLSDFHLYLSPSRLAHLDVLSDSDSDSDIEEPPPPPSRTGRPENVGAKEGIMARRQKPPLPILGKLANEDARSYSDRLQAHHAKILETYRGSTMVEACSTPTQEVVPETFAPDSELAVGMVHERPSTPCSATTPGPPVQPSPRYPQELADDKPVRSISAFRSDINPWYGYPAVYTGTELKPRYTRNRKRDLVKTLLFLFILRIQSWRDAFERFLGLNGLGTWGYRTQPSTKLDSQSSSDPGQGLVNSVSQGRDMRMVNGTDKDWIWMAVTFLLLRGTWARVLGGPLEAVGLGSVRSMLGLA